MQLDQNPVVLHIDSYRVSLSFIDDNRPTGFVRNTTVSRHFKCVSFEKTCSSNEKFIFFFQKFGNLARFLPALWLIRLHPDKFAPRDMALAIAAKTGLAKASSEL